MQGPCTALRRGIAGASLVVHRLGICWPTQRTQVRSLVWELKSHMPQSNSAHEPQLLSLHSRAHELQPLNPVCFTALAPQQEKTLQ